MATNINEIIARLDTLKKNADEPVEVPLGELQSDLADLIQETWSLALYARGLEAELRRVRGLAEGAESAAREATADTSELHDIVYQLQNAVDDKQ
jgi:hypothetical protein